MALQALRDIVIEPMIQLVFMKGKSEKLASATIEELQQSIKVQSSESVYYKWNDEGKNLPTNYSILFQMDAYKYRYEISIWNHAIQEENLYVEDASDEVEVLFERDLESVYLCEELSGFDIEQSTESTVRMAERSR